MKKKKSKWMYELKLLDSPKLYGPEGFEDIFDFVDRNGQYVIKENTSIKKFRRSFLWFRKLRNLNYNGTVMYFDQPRVLELAGISKDK